MKNIKLAEGDEVRDAIEAAKRFIRIGGGDGPVNAYGLMARACRYSAQAPGLAAEVVPNALYELLKDHGFLSELGEEG